MRTNIKDLEYTLIEVTNLLKRPLLYTNDDGKCNLGYLYLTGVFKGRLSLMEVCSFSGASNILKHGTLKEVLAYLEGILDYSKLLRKTFPLPESR